MAKRLSAEQIVTKLRQIEVLQAQGKTEAAVARLENEIERGSPLFLSSIVFYELAYGIAKSTPTKKNFERLSEFLLPITDIIPFERDDTVEAGDIRVALERQGTPIGPNDVLIAAQVRRRRGVMDTHNIKEFSRIPTLIVAD